MVNLLLVVLTFSTASSFCFGYVDPGAGHLLWQALFAGFFGGLFFLKRLFSFIPTRRGREFTKTE